MKSIVIKPAIILLILLVLFTGCHGIVTEQEAIKIAEDIISKDFPDMVDATRTFDSYTSDGKEFYDVTYSKTVEVQTEEGAVELPRIVIITIDKDSGEQFVAISG
jgi:hypothetical protein